MARRTLVFALVAAGAVAGPAAPRTAVPRLSLVSDAPVVVRGSGFAPGERVALRAVTRSGRYARSVAAGPRGAFTARWTLPADYCTGIYLVTASGSRGSSARLRVALASQDCAPLSP